MTDEIISYSEYESDGYEEFTTIQSETGDEITENISYEKVVS